MVFLTISQQTNFPYINGATTSVSKIEINKKSPKC